MELENMTPKEPDDQKPEESSSECLSYPLIAAFDPQLKFNILKFAPSSNRRVDLSTFVQPVKLNRKDPWAIRKKAEEEKKKLAESTNQDGEDIKPHLQDDIKFNSSEQQKPTSAAGKLIKDDSIVAPSPASQSKLKTQPFKKKTKQVFIASDQASRMLKKEEYQSWLLEDGSRNGERWIGRYESAGAVTSTSGSNSNNSTTMNNDASNYVLFRLDGTGVDFQVIPCHRFYRFTQRPNYDTLGPDEAGAAYEKMQKPTTKEDVGRWFMRRRGVSSNTENNQQVKSEDTQKATSSHTGFFDHSKVAFGTQNQIKNQVEIPNFINGRRNKFTTVHGANQSSNFNDDEADKKPNFGQEGDFDEVDYEAEFDDDEEGAGNLNDEAMEEDEVKELADKMKREMLAAGKAGDDERNKQNIDMGKDPLFGERADLTKEGKAVKKLLMRKGDDDVYGSDEDVRNPYASEDDDSDLEEVAAPVNANLASPLDGKQSASRSGTPAPGLQSNNATIGSRNLTKVAGSQPTNLKTDKSHSRPPSRSGTPGLPVDGRMNPSLHPMSGASGFTASGVNRSRATSPQILPSSKASHSGTVSPVLSPFLKSSPSSPIHVNTNGNGKRKQHPTGAIMNKDKKLNAGPGPGIYLVEKLSSTNMPSSVNFHLNRTDQGNTNVLSKERIIELLRRNDRTTKELLSHFKNSVQDPRNRADFGVWVKEVSTLVNGRWVLKDGI